MPGKSWDMKASWNLERLWKQNLQTTLSTASSSWIICGTTIRVSQRNMHQQQPWWGSAASPWDAASHSSLWLNSRAWRHHKLIETAQYFWTTSWRNASDHTIVRCSRAPTKSNECSTWTIIFSTRRSSMQSWQQANCYHVDIFLKAIMGIGLHLSQMIRCLNGPNGQVMSMC